MIKKNHKYVTACDDFVLSATSGGISINSLASVIWDSAGIANASKCMFYAFIFLGYCNNKESLRNNKK